MAEYLHHLAAHAGAGRLAIVEAATPANPSPALITYEQLLARVIILRERLHLAAQESHKPLEGARIGLMVPAGVDYAAAVLAIWSVSAIVVPICLTHPLAEIRYTVTDSDQDFIIYHANFFSRIQSLLDKRAGIDVTTIPRGAKAKRHVDFSALDAFDDIPCTIIYTSGTTGPPKGVVHSTRSTVCEFRSLAEVWQLTPADRVLHVLPLHHGHGMSLALLLPLFVGATVEFMPHFDEALAWQRFMNTSLYPITVFMAVPTMWVRLISYFKAHYDCDPILAKNARDAATTLRLPISGSAALPQPVQSDWADIAHGQMLLERYGMTETGITYSERLTPNGRIQGSVGWPLPGVQSRLIAPDGRDVSMVPDEMGEIQIKTPNLMKGYWRKPAATKKEMTADGWWRTGDIAMIKKEHNNALFIQGRASADIIKSGGFKISALDVEAALSQLPFIQETAVIGTSDPVWGEVVTAICVPKAGKVGELTLENVKRCLRTELASYKVPRKLHLLDSLPRNAMGKVQKKSLREQCFPQQQRARL